MANPIREKVLAWMDSTDNGYVAAADHHGLNTETVKSWVKRRPKPAPAAAPVPR